MLSCLLTATTPAIIPATAVVVQVDAALLLSGRCVVVVVLRALRHTAALRHPGCLRRRRVHLCQGRHRSHSSLSAGNLTWLQQRPVNTCCVYMYVCVRMCVCVSVCLSVCVSVCVFVCVCAPPPLHARSWAEGSLVLAMHI